jgi:NADH-ubiquinone oxidoreductase chain 1
VSGFMTEHSAIIFVFFFLAEYASIILISILTSILFLGGYLPPFQSIMAYISNPILEGIIYGVTLGVKTCIIVFGFIWVRASFPRIRYDQLMSFCWTVLLPLVFAFMFLELCILGSFDALPTNVFGLLIPGIVSYNTKGLVNKSQPLLMGAL